MLHPVVHDALSRHIPNDPALQAQGGQGRPAAWSAAQDEVPHAAQQLLQRGGVAGRHEHGPALDGTGPRHQAFAQLPAEAHSSGGGGGATACAPPLAGGGDSGQSREGREEALSCGPRQSLHFCLQQRRAAFQPVQRAIAEQLAHALRGREAPWHAVQGQDAGWREVLVPHLPPHGHGHVRESRDCRRRHCRSARILHDGGHGAGHIRASGQPEVQDITAIHAVCDVLVHEQGRRVSIWAEGLGRGEASQPAAHDWVPLLQRPAHFQRELLDTQLVRITFCDL